MKKILFLSMNFPPMMTEGSSRVMKLASFLPAHGWEPVVIGNHSLAGERIEEFPFELLYAGTGLQRKEMNDEQLFRILHGLAEKKPAFGTRKSGGVHIPQGREGEEFWRSNAASLAGKLLQDNPDIEMIYAQSPPFAPQQLALELSLAHNLPVMFDCTGFFPVQKQEMSVLLSGQYVTVPSRAVKEHYLRKYKGKLGHDDVSILPNGYDSGTCRTKAPGLRDDASMLCVFHIEGAQGKGIKNFFLALRAFLESHEAAKRRFSCTFIGSGAVDVDRYLKKHGIEGLVRLSSPCSRTEELDLCMRADMYCIVLGREDWYEYIVPERLYDCMAMQRAVAGIVPDSQAKQVLEEAGGRTVLTDHTPHIIDFLMDSFDLWRTGQLRAVDPERLDQHDFRRVTQVFLREIVARFPSV